MSMNQEKNFTPFSGSAALQEGLISAWPVSSDCPSRSFPEDVLPAGWKGALPVDFARSPAGYETPYFNGKSFLEVSGNPLLHRQEFSFEAWVNFKEPPAGPQTLAELAGGHGKSWRFGLSRHLELEFIWFDDSGERGKVASVQMVDMLRPDSWIHLAVAFRNHCYTGQPYIRDYSRVHLYCTPLGERFPRIAGSLRDFDRPQVTEKPARLFIGSDSAGDSPWKGAVADAAFTGRAKLANEFPSLGQHAPEELVMSDDFVAGSAFCPVVRAENDIVVGCKPYTGSGNYWFYARVEDTGSPDRERKVKVEVLPVPGGSSMLMSMFLSYDKMSWQRLDKGYYLCDRGSPLPGSYSFSAVLQRFPAWLCSFIPYTTDDIDELEKDLLDNRYAEVISPSRSVEGRPIRLFKITDTDVPDNRKRVVYIQAGQHSPSEMAPGRIIDRMARHLAGCPASEPGAGFSGGGPGGGSIHSAQEFTGSADLLKNTVFLLVPIVNVDCCFHGGSGANINGVNTNRDWINPTQPETSGLKAFIDGWIADGFSLDIALDLHAGGIHKNHFVLALEKDADEAVLPAGWYAAQEKFMSALEAHTGIAREDAKYSGLKEGTFVQALVSEYGAPAFCIEFSHMTCRDVPGVTGAVTQEHLERLGPRFLKALEAWMFDDNGACQLNKE